MLLEGSKTWKSNAEVAPGGLRNPAYGEFIGFRWEQKVANAQITKRARTNTINGEVTKIRCK